MLCGKNVNLRAKVYYDNLYVKVNFWINLNRAFDFARIDSYNTYIIFVLVHVYARAWFICMRMCMCYEKKGLIVWELEIMCCGNPFKTHRRINSIDVTWTIYIFYIKFIFSIGFFPLLENDQRTLLSTLQIAPTCGAPRFSAVEKMIYLSCHPGNFDKTILVNWFIYINMYVCIFMYSFVIHFFDFKNS